MGLFTIHGNHYKFSGLFTEPDDADLPNTTKTRYLLIQTEVDKPLTMGQYVELDELGFQVVEYLGKDIYLLYWPPVTGSSNPPPAVLELETIEKLKVAKIPRVSFYHKQISASGSDKQGSEEQVVDEFEGELEDEYEPEPDTKPDTTKPEPKPEPTPTPEVIEKPVKSKAVDSRATVCLSLYPERYRYRSTAEIIQDLISRSKSSSLLASKPSLYQPISDALDITARTNLSAAPIPGISGDLIYVTVNRNLVSWFQWPAELLREWGTIDEVCAISEVHPPRPCCEQSRKVLGVDKIPDLGAVGATSAALEYTGKGQTVAVCDGGIDLGRIDNLHRAFTPGAVTLLRNFAAEKEAAQNLAVELAQEKVEYKRLIDNAAADFADLARFTDHDGHGTVVCGCIAANDDRETEFELFDGRKVKFSDLKGVAPDAKLVVQTDYNWAASKALKYTEPLQRHRACIHNNSICGHEKAYTKSAGGLIDETVWRNRHLLTVFAAGNEGHYVEDITLSKNGLAVGATAHQFNSQTGKPDMSTIARANASFGTRTKSSYGTPLNGRIKPELVAPGVRIAAPKSRGLARPPTDPNGTYEQVWKVDDDTITSNTGTSFAAPLVSGCAAVIRQVLFQRLPHRYNSINPPPAALMKAFLINAAIPLPRETGANAAGQGTRRRTGFGRVDLEGSVKHILAATDDTITGSGFKAALTTDDTKVKDYIDVATVTVPANNHPRTLTITLVYTDAEGEKLQHDINLVVRQGAVERHGNRGVQAGYDNVNNSERIIWRNIEAGEVKIKLYVQRIAYNIEGFPDYAVVWHLTETQA